MALSEEEKKLLAQMEAALAAEDPKLVNTFRGSTSRRRHRRRATLAGIGFFIGLGLLLAGLATYPAVSVVGFVLMVACAVGAIYAWQHVSHAPEEPEQPQRPSSSPSARYQPNVSRMEKFEARWKRRREEGF